MPLARIWRQQFLLSGVQEQVINSELNWYKRYVTLVEMDNTFVFSTQV
jgi:hypothetical protein